MNNEYEPTAEEATWPPTEAAEEGEGANESSTDPKEETPESAEQTGEDADEDEDTAEGLEGLPGFWMACLTSNEMIASVRPFSRCPLPRWLLTTVCCYYM